jgi:hypothetical protein
MRPFGKALRQIARDAPKSISNEEISVIWEKAQRDFAHAVGSLVVQKISELQDRLHTSAVIPPAGLGIVRFVINYFNILRERAGYLAATLAKTIGHRQFGREERGWISKAASKFISERRSRLAADALFAETLELFPIQNKRDAQKILRQSFTGLGLTNLLMVRVRKELKFARTQYQERQRSKEKDTPTRIPRSSKSRTKKPLEPRLSLSAYMEMKSLSATQAASALALSHRTIRHYLRMNKLNGSEKGRVVCDETFAEEYKRRHASIRKH